MDYAWYAAEFRRIRFELLYIKGDRLIRDMERAWDNGDTVYYIPAGDYAINRDIPYPRDRAVQIIGAGGGYPSPPNGTHIHAPWMNPFAPYPYQRRQPDPPFSSAYLTSDWHSSHYLSHGTIPVLETKDPSTG